MQTIGSSSDEFSAKTTKETTELPFLTCDAPVCGCKSVDATPTGSVDGSLYGIAVPLWSRI